MATKLPKVGNKIPIEKFHVSEMNMRHGQPFPVDEQDEILITNLRVRKNKKHRLAEPIRARPETDGYGIVTGKRKFEALKIVGVKELIVGFDCTISEMSDEEALDLSWNENSELLRKWPDPITRAKVLSKRHANSGLSLRDFAKFDGAGVSTYSEWLKILDLNPKMQEAVSKKHIFYKDGLETAKLKLGTKFQDKLAAVAEKEGRDVFLEELAKVRPAGMTRGLPKDVYFILRIPWDKRYKPDTEDYEKLGKLAKAEEKPIDDYAKEVLREHIKSKA